MTEPALFVGCREDDPHRRVIPGSKVLPCSKCGEPTTFSPATMARSEASHPDTLFICLECADLDGLKLYPPTGAQVNELEQAGHDPESWPLREHWGRKLVRNTQTIDGWYCSDAKDMRVATKDMVMVTVSDSGLVLIGDEEHPKNMHEVPLAVLRWLMEFVSKEPKR